VYIVLKGKVAVLKNKNLSKNQNNDEEK